jgi:hypothetical protein
MTGLLSSLLHNDLAIIFTAIVLLTVIPIGMTYWFKAKKAAMDADLKMKMLELGMSADEIERVLVAESMPDGNNDLRGRAAQARRSS